jgi:hypothetical protein
MIGDPCAELRRWLASPGADSSPDPTLVAHVAGCPRCRGELARLSAELVAPPPEHQPSCETVADDLPVYVEFERAQGEVAAARQYHATWWHLWTCPACAGVASDLSMLLAAEAEGELGPPPLLKPMPAPAVALTPSPLRLARELLHAVFAPQQLLGATWNGGDDRLFLAEETLPGYRLVIHVRQESSEHWVLEVSVEPPVTGELVVQLADAHFRARLLDGRHARLRGIPTALLAGKTGPDLLLSIEREADDDRDATS